DRQALAKRLALIAGLWVVGLALVGFVLLSALTRAFVIDSNGVLTTSAPQTVRAPDTGTLLAWSANKGDLVRPAQPLASIESLDGVRLAVQSPCDCIVADLKVEPGEVLGRGAPLLTLAPANAPLAGEFVVPLADAKRLRQGDSVTIDFFGQHPAVKGRVKTVNLPTFPDESAYARDRNGAMQLTAVVRVELTEKAPFTLIGRPAAARINTMRTPF
ncbi:MAG TPA: HlyD family secretion protein, partial [Phenylobacterium sp.]